MPITSEPAKSKQVPLETRALAEFRQNLPCKSLILPLCLKKRGDMESGTENVVVEQLNRIPFVGKWAADLGRRAVAATEGIMGTERIVDIVGYSIDERDRQEINAIETLSNATTPEMHPIQAKSLAVILARRALRHMNDPISGTYLLDLKRFMYDETPEGMTLENIGLEAAELEQLHKYV